MPHMFTDFFSRLTRHVPASSLLLCTSLLATALFAACGSDEKIVTVPPSVLDPEHYEREEAPKRKEYRLSVKETTPIATPPKGAYSTDSGLRFVVFSRGESHEHPLSTTTVTVHYQGYTSDEQIFDSSIRRNEPASFRLDQVIPGWREGVKLMTKGDKFRFWIPEKEAYRGMEGKPKGDLIFDVELIDMENEDSE